MGRPRVTSFDVARAAGVSQSAVSRAYTPGASVSEKTKKKVFEAAQKLGYQPNAIARSLISRRSNMIGLVMADVVNPFYPPVLELFMRNFREQGQRVMLFLGGHNQDVDELLPQVLEYQVDGIVITSSTLSSEMAEHCNKLGTPITLFNRYVPNAEVDSVCSDNIDAARNIADLFISAGHKRLAYISGQINTSTNQDRQKGFFSRAEERRQPEPVMAEGDWSYQSGFDAALKLFSEEKVSTGQYPDAVFCANDLMGLGALDAIRYKRNLRVPEDVSVIGFDDTDSCSWHNYRLTTVRTPVEKMVISAVENMIARINNPEKEIIAVLEQSQLIVRDTARLPDQISMPFVADSLPADSAARATSET